MTYTIFPTRHQRLARLRAELARRLDEIPPPAAELLRLWKTQRKLHLDGLRREIRRLALRESKR